MEFDADIHHKLERKHKAEDAISPLPTKQSNKPFFDDVILTYKDDKLYATIYTENAVNVDFITVTLFESAQEKHLCCCQLAGKDKDPTGFTFAKRLAIVHDVDGLRVLRKMPFCCRYRQKC